MLNKYARAFVTRLFTPLANLLIRLGVSPDVVTVIGTLGVCAGALIFYPQGKFLTGTLVITAFVFSDTLDGIMARAQDRQGKWGAFLDSTLDRFADAAIFTGLALYFAGRADQLMTGIAIACLIFGAIVSYARARAEGLGMTGNVGIAERAERLVIVLVATGLTGLFDLPLVVLEVVLGLLALASLITIGQRMAHVQRQTAAEVATLGASQSESV
ncbi:phosphatidylinositol phosphate synthase [Actinomycetota bacterium]